MAAKARRTTAARSGCASQPSITVAAPMIQVGATKEGVAELRACISEILTTPGLDNATRQQALQVLSKGVSADNASFSNLNLNLFPPSQA